jgi:hypothetical protein
MKQYFLTLSMVALSVTGMFAPNLKASGWDKRTNVTINHAIEVDGIVLPAGSYVLKLVNPPSRYVVEILNADETRVITTVIPNRTYRLAPAVNSELNFYEAESGQTPALHTWFYPGDSTGFEFRAGHGTPTIEAAQGASTTAPIASSN